LEDYGQNVKPNELKMKKSYFGIQICLGARSLITKYSLKKRKYLYTTSMSSQLSFLVANEALSKKNTIIMDPFVGKQNYEKKGTGSILISCKNKTKKRCTFWILCNRRGYRYINK
jgi:tRNA G10  N-methylase Trm11